MFERNRIAEMLRSAREKRGLSLEQVATAAGIPLQYLRLLEGESNVQIGVSDELYLIPFFRKYARFFEIDAEGMLPEFLGMVQQVPGEASPPIRLTYRPRWAFLWKPAAVLFTIGVAVLLMLRQVPQHQTFDDPASGGESEPREQSDSSATEPAAMPSSTVSDADATPVPGAVIAPTSSPAGAATTTPSPDSIATPVIASTGAHDLRITAVEDAWLALAVDDQTAKQYLLRAGETRSWNAERFSLTVGNAGGITLALDGRELPPIGRPGKVVRNLHLPADASSPSPSPAGE